MAKGKQVDSKSAEKLTRNEDKLIKIKEASSQFINNLCLLMEEITERSWRDLHPMLVKCSQFEVQVSGDEAKAFVAMNEVVTALKKVASDHGIKPEARLKDLQTLDPSVLSTRSKDDNRNLAIENGFAGMALGQSGTGIGISAGSSTGSGSSAFGGGDDAMHFPPGSTHPQGLGGFPVRVAPDDGISTMNMMNMNAAPAPTMDTMAQAFGSGASATATRSAPNSGGIPSYNNSMDGHRNYSMNSLHSDFSAAPAPPPMGAPPPPPPSMGGSMNDGYNPFGGGGGGQVPNQQPPAPPPPMGYPQQQQQQQQQGGYHQQAGNFAQQQSMQGGNFAQQQQPMYGGQPQQQYNQQQQYGSNNINTNPFG